MRERLVAAALAAGVLAGCTSGQGARAPGVTPLPAEQMASQPAPATAILDAAAAGRPLTGSADGVTPAEAANGVPDAADALPLFDSWGWVVESRRSYGGGAGAVDATLLLTLRPSGAESAFAFLSEETAVPPLVAAACPADLLAEAAGADQCALGRGAGRALVVARVGLEVFEISAADADAVRLAALQARRLRAE